MKNLKIIISLTMFTVLSIGAFAAQKLKTEHPYPFCKTQKPKLSGECLGNTVFCCVSLATGQAYSGIRQW